jgi:glycosyltransferase involved in cell wall biosynthesis
MESGRVDVIATGLVELDRTGRAKRDNRLRYDGAVFLAGQRLQIPVADARREAKAQRVQIISELPAVDFWAADRALYVEPGDWKPMADSQSGSALKIVAGTGYDPGNAAYRFHNALTECTPHGTAFVRYMRPKNNPYDCPVHVDAGKDMARVRALILEADVVHCHIDPVLTQNAGLPRRPRAGQIVIRHYHGTQFAGAHQRADADQWPMLSATQDDAVGYVLVGARLQVCALRPGRIQWLPITVPCSRYAAMAKDRSPREGRPFRVAHSPTLSRIKGTAEFRKAIARLRKRGIAIEAVMIEGKSHLQALQLKATADACFDSFALGIQGSGLEAAAMGQPVIAGDSRVKELHEAEVGYCPYTFAGDQGALEAALERLALDPAFYAAESTRVSSYCLQYHDYPVVAARYERILKEAA